AQTQRLEIRQGQALVMTPQLMQAIKLLQLSSLDLAAYVDAAVESNPLLERGSEGDGEAPQGAEVAEPPQADGGIQAGDWLGDELETSRTAIEQRLETDLENVFPSELPDPAPRSQPADLPATSDWSGVGNGGRDGE